MASPVQSQSYRGSIRGTVTDPSGAVMVGARITVKSSTTGLTREEITSADGSYVVSELPSGEYLVTIRLAPFADFVGKAIVEVGLDTNFDAKMQLKGTEGQVVVTTAIPIVEATQDVLGGTVEHSGVAGTEKGFGQFNINGQRDRSNNYTLDGTDNNDPWFNNSALNQVGITGAPATLLPIDAIQEFNLQNQFPAEYGRNTGGVVNIITKSGTNDFHGSAFEYARNSFWDA